MKAWHKRNREQAGTFSKLTLLVYYDSEQMEDLALPFILAFCHYFLLQNMPAQFSLSLSSQHTLTWNRAFVVFEYGFLPVTEMYLTFVRFCHM